LAYLIFKSSFIFVIIDSLLKKRFKNLIGYSDHSLANEAAISAVTLGARVIEKHITLNKNFSGPDHKASLEPLEFIDFVKSIRNTETILANKNKNLINIEKINKALIRKSIVAKRNIKKGEKFTIENITTKRPEGGMPPTCWNKVIGKKSIKDFNHDDFIVLK
jgi:N,N'-diacetyllegionaminate synthase